MDDNRVTNNGSVNARTWLRQYAAVIAGQSQELQDQNLARAFVLREMVDVIQVVIGAVTDAAQISAAQQDVLKDLFENQSVTKVSGYVCAAIAFNTTDETTLAAITQVL